MAVVGESITLDAVAFDLLWERLALGAFPLVLQLRSHGDTFTERHALLDGARRRLQQDGLLDGTDVHPRLAHWLQVLAQPEDEVDVRWRDGATELRATVVRQGDSTVRVVRRVEELTLTPVTPGSMPSAAVDVLPMFPPPPSVDRPAHRLRSCRRHTPPRPPRFRAAPRPCSRWGRTGRTRLRWPRLC